MATKEDFYVAFGVAKDAPPAEIRKAYYKLALKHHPDRLKNDQEKEKANAEFQRIGRMYEVLSDPDRRQLYDETGMVDDVLKDTEVRDWAVYWRMLFKKISLDDIKDFERSYKGSVLEMEDVKEAYNKAKGDMGRILELVWSTYEDEERFRKIIDDAIANKQLKALTKYTQETKQARARRVKKAEKEAKEAEEHAKQLGIQLSYNEKAKQTTTKTKTKTKVVANEKENKRKVKNEEPSKVPPARKSKRLAKKRIAQDDESEEDDDYRDVVDLVAAEEEAEEEEEEVVAVREKSNKKKAAGGDSFLQMIANRPQQRKMQFESLMVSLQSKYGGSKESMPSETDFQNASKRLHKRKEESSKRKKARVA